MCSYWRSRFAFDPAGITTSWFELNREYPRSGRFTPR
jgi:hypothetical protein